MKLSYTATKLTCYVGYVVQAVVNNFLPILFIALQDVYGLSYEKLARIIVFNFTSQMVTDIFTPKIIEFLGYRKASILSQGTAAFGLALLGVLPRIIDAYTGIIISVIIYACGSGLMEVVLSPLVEMLPTKNKAGNMAVLHSFYCWGQAFTVIVTTLLVTVFGYIGWYYIPLIWALLPFVNMFSFFKVPIVEPKPDEKKDSLKELFKNRKFRYFMIMMLCAGASEIAMAQWASIFAQRALGVSKVVGDLAGPCAFALFMGLGRVLYALFSEKISFRKTLIIINIASFICYITVATCKIPLIALIACALCGLTVSIAWPGTYSAGAKAFPNGSALMFSIFAMCGDTGCCLGPWVLGIIADKMGLNIGFAVVSVFPIIMIYSALKSYSKK